MLVNTRRPRLGGIVTDRRPATVAIATDDLLAAHRAAFYESCNLERSGDHHPNRWDALMCRLQGCLAAAYYEMNRRS